jgi:hypothetical protein
MPVSPRVLPSELGHSFTPADAAALGVTPRRLRAGDLDKPFHGVRQRVLRDPVMLSNADAAAAPSAADRVERTRVLRLVHAYERVKSHNVFYVGCTAAVLHGLAWDHGDELEVAVTAPVRAPRGRGIRSRQMAPGLVSIRSVDGIAVASPASVWANLARNLGDRDLVRLGDALVRIPRDSSGQPMPERQLATPPQLLAAAEVRHRRGRPRLLAALDQVRVGSMSPLETDFRVDSMAVGLPEPTLDVEIRDGYGRLIGIADAAYLRERVIVEVEGDHHRVSRSQWQRDIEKHAAYVAAGWEVVRLTSSHVRGPAATAPEVVRGALMRRGWRP